VYAGTSLTLLFAATTAAYPLLTQHRVVSVLEGGYGKPSQAEDKRYYSKPPAPPTQQQQHATQQQPLPPPAPVPVPVPADPAAALAAAAAAAAAVAAGGSTTATGTTAAASDAPTSTSGVPAAGPFPLRPHSSSSSPTSDDEQPPEDGPTASANSSSGTTGYQFVAKHDVQALDRSGLADAVAEHVRSLVDPYRISESALLAQQQLQEGSGSSSRGGRSVSPKPPARGAGTAVKKARPCKYCCISSTYMYVLYCFVY
jgi:hypothetical protein